MREIRVPVSLGELADKVSILEIKAARIVDPARRANVARELDALRQAWADAALPELEALDGWAELVKVNTALWEIEDEIRAHELRQDFGPRFVELARAVYVTNDRRAAIKRAINLALGSALVEEKSYVA